MIYLGNVIILLSNWLKPSIRHRAWEMHVRVQQISGKTQNEETFVQLRICVENGAQNLQCYLQNGPKMGQTSPNMCKNRS